MGWAGFCGFSFGMLVFFPSPQFDINLVKRLLNLQGNEFTYASITINICNLMDFKAKGGVLPVFCKSKKVHLQL